MTSKQPPQTAVFTPKPRTNALLGSWQLLFWLFWRPSAWYAHLAELQLDLAPDFCLIELNRRSLLTRRFWHFLLQLTVGWLTVGGGVLFFALLLMGLHADSALLWTGAGLLIGFTVLTAVSIGGSFTTGIITGAMATVVASIGGGLMFSPEGFLSAAAIDPARAVWLMSMLVGLASGLGAGFAYPIVNRSGGEQTEITIPAHSAVRQIGGAAVGAVVGILSGQLIGTITGVFAMAAVTGIPFGIIIGRRTRIWQRGLIGALLIVTIIVLAAGLGELGVNTPLLRLAELGALIVVLFALPYYIAERMAGAGAGAVAGALGSGGGIFLFLVETTDILPTFIFSLGGLLLGLTIAWWRPVLLYPFVMAWNLSLFRRDERVVENGRLSWFRWHTAFWDEFQRLPLLGLDRYLLFLHQHDPALARAGLVYLSRGRQRWASRAVQIELDARQLEQCQDVEAISAIPVYLDSGELADAANALMRRFNRISQDTAAALAQESVYNQRLALNSIEDRLDGLTLELTRSQEPYTVRFISIADEWRRIVHTCGQNLAKEADRRQEIDSPYIIGVPLTERQEIFIGRVDISSRIEQLLLDRRQPPLLLYGQRRVGKTSLLNNLGRLFPSTIIPMFVDLQGPASRAKDDAGFLYNLARAMRRSAQRQREIELPSLLREQLADDPYTQFEEWLDEVEETLAGQMALLILDEFEVLDAVLTQERFDETAVMGMLRHLIQHRPRFKVLLSGSHTLNELQRWTSYLINVQVIHVGYLRDEEARQLIEQPVEGFTLKYEEEASQRVLSLTRGHPFLVQLLCAEIVALKNEQPSSLRRLARLEDVETAVPIALQHGSFFFADIQQNQITAVEADILRVLAQEPERTVMSPTELAAHLPKMGDIDEHLSKLQQRELVEIQDGGIRFQMPLIRLWFLQN